VHNDCCLPLPDDQDSVPWTVDKRWGLAESDRAVALDEHCSRSDGGGALVVVVVGPLGAGSDAPSRSRGSRIGRWAVADTTSDGGRAWVESSGQCMWAAVVVVLPVESAVWKVLLLLVV
jgi:hypothetical protein